MFRVRGGYQYNIHGIELLKVVNFLKYLGPPKKELNKIDFMYYYEIVHTKKPLGHLRQRFISVSFIPRV